MFIALGELTAVRDVVVDNEVLHAAIQLIIYRVQSAAAWQRPLLPERV